MSDTVKTFGNLRVGQRVTICDEFDAGTAFADRHRGKRFVIDSIHPDNLRKAELGGAWVSLKHPSGDGCAWVNEIVEFNKGEQNMERKFKIGDPVELLTRYGGHVPGETGRVTNVKSTNDEAEGGLITVQLLNGGSINCYGSRLKISAVTFDNISVGDRFTDAGGMEEREVVAVGPKYIGTIDIYDGTNDPSGYTIKELKEEGYKIIQPEVTTELTLQEIANKLGIPVEKLRIKE